RLRRSRGTGPDAPRDAAPATRPDRRVHHPAADRAPVPAVRRSEPLACRAGRGSPGGVPSPHPARPPGVRPPRLANHPGAGERRSAPARGPGHAVLLTGPAWGDAPDRAVARRPDRVVPDALGRARRAGLDEWPGPPA